MNTEASETKEMVAANFKIPVDLRQAAESLAQKRGTTFSRVIREALDLFIHLDAPVWPAVQDMADTYGLPESKIVRNIILNYIGERQAMDEIYGANDQRIVTEFSRTRKGETLVDDQLIAEAKKTYAFLLRTPEMLKEAMEISNRRSKAEGEVIEKNERTIKSLVDQYELMASKVSELSAKIGMP